MKVGIIQSNYIPWRGYFDFIDDVDLFIFHDDLQYTKGDWRNRNKIKTEGRTRWVTVPVKYGSKELLICNTPIDYSQAWTKKHINQFKTWYSRTPFFESYSHEFFYIMQKKHDTISGLNIDLCHWIMKKIEIDTPTRLSSELQPQGSKTERLIDLLKKVKAKTYLSGPSAKGYLDENLFRKHGISLDYKTYDYAPYPQLWGDFVGEVTVLDLLFNLGPNARQYLKSQSSNHAVVR